MPAKAKTAVVDPTGRLPYCREDIDILCSSAQCGTLLASCRLIARVADVESCPPPQRASWEAAATIMLEVVNGAGVSREFVVELLCKVQATQELRSVAQPLRPSPEPMQRLQHHRRAALCDWLRPLPLL